MASKRDRDLEKVYSTKQFVAKLRRLADVLETGKPFTIRVAGEGIRVPDDAVFNIEHERSGAEEEVEFQLKWRRQRAAAGAAKPAKSAKSTNKKARG